MGADHRRRQSHPHVVARRQGLRLPQGGAPRSRRRRLDGPRGRARRSGALFGRHALPRSCASARPLRTRPTWGGGFRRRRSGQRTRSRARQAHRRAGRPRLGAGARPAARRRPPQLDFPGQRDGRGRGRQAPESPRGHRGCETVAPHVPNGHGRIERVGRSRPRLLRGLRRARLPSRESAVRRRPARLRGAHRHTGAARGRDRRDGSGSPPETNS